MSRGWEWKTLKQLCKPTTNTNPNLLPEEEFNYIDIDSINNITHEITNPKLVLGKDAPSRARQVVHINDILFSTVRPYLKNIARVNSSYDNDIASTGFSLIRLDSSMDSNYVFHYVKTDRFLSELERYYKGSSYPAVTDSDLMGQSIPVPPIETQRKIVAILDKVEDTKRLRAQSNELTQKLLQSVFLEMFGDPIRNEKGWPIVTIGEITEYHKQGLYTDSEYTKNGINLVRITDITELGKIDYSSMPFLELDEKTISQFSLIKDEFIFARSGSIGRCAIVENDIPCVFGSFIIKFKFNPNLINNHFMLYLIRHPSIQTRLKHHTHGSTNSNINAENIKEMKIVLPPIFHQIRFSQIVQEIQKLPNYQGKVSVGIDELMTSIINSAFSGELIA